VVLIKGYEIKCWAGHGEIEVLMTKLVCSKIHWLYRVYALSQRLELNARRGGFGRRWCKRECGIGSGAAEMEYPLGRFDTNLQRMLIRSSQNSLSEWFEVELTTLAVI
jgi:hypothetical protein